MNLASSYGCDDLDPEPAVGLLEETGWDVGEALARLFGEPQGHDDASMGSRRQLARFTHLEFLAALDAALETAMGNRTSPSAAIRVSLLSGRQAEARGLGARTSQAEVIARSRTSEALDDELSSEGDDRSQSEGEDQMPGQSFNMEPVFPVEGQHATAQLSRDDALQRQHTSGYRYVYRPRHSLASILGPRMGANRMHRGMLDEAYMLADQEDEGLSVVDLVHAMLRTQDEADFQDAVRLSAEEAYSGGFGVPPADEAVLATCTRTYTCEGPCGDESPGQCAVCLGDFEAGDSLRMLQCKHHFHMACVDQWLGQSGQCPVCKRCVGP